LLPKSNIPRNHTVRRSVSVHSGEVATLSLGTQDFMTLFYSYAHLMHSPYTTTDYF